MSQQKQPVEIYKNVDAIFAEKGGNSLWPNKPFKHKFKKGAGVFGVRKTGGVKLKKGDLVIRSRQGDRLWKFFDYKKGDAMKEPFLINPPGSHARKHGRDRSGKKKKFHHRSRKSNPLGETLVTVGGNPMQYFHRRNPVQAGLGGAMNVRGWAPLAVTGGLSAAAGAIIPGMLAQFTGTNPWVNIGVRLAVAFGGGMAVGQYVSKEHGSVWAVVGTSLVAYDLLKQYLFPTLGLAGNGGYEYEGYTEGSDSQVNAFPNGGMSAYPDQGGIQAFPLGEVGSYPYDGSYGHYATMT